MLKQLLESAKQNQGRDDPELANKLRNIEAEVLRIEKDLKATDDNVNDLRKKRNESKKTLDEIRASPDRFTPQQIDGMLVSLEEQNERADELVEKITIIEREEDQKIRELKDLVSGSDARRAHLDRIQQIMAQIREDMDSFKSLNDTLPGQMDQILQTLREEKNGSSPDDTADYWEERHKIDRNTVEVNNCRTKFSSLLTVYQRKKEEISQAENTLKKIVDIDGLARHADDLENIRIDLEDKLNDAYDIRDELKEIKKNMGECEIPVNVAMRRNELEALSERLDRINDDFGDLR